MKKAGFTLLEILIVVIIMGILAAVVTPKFTSASESAKEAMLKKDLQTLRSQCNLYRVQHGDRYPWEIMEDATFVAVQLLYRTDEQGDIDPGDGSGDYKYGPYLERIPENPFVLNRRGSFGCSSSPDESARYQIVLFGTDCPYDDTSSWYVNTATGKITQNSSKRGLDIDGCIEDRDGG